MLARFALPLALAATPLAAAEPQPAAASEAPAPPVQQAAEGIVAVLMSQRPAAEVFSPQFLAAVPPDKLSGLVAQIAAQFGTLEGLDRVTSTGPTGGVIALRFRRAVYSGPFSLGPDGKVAGLLLNDYRMLGDGLPAIQHDLAALPGTVGAYYGPIDGAGPVLAVNADRQFAIGSTFKLYVLAALAKQIARGTHRWDEVVRIDDQRSLPSGQMQDWPKNAPVTLHTLATMMISISDNTATDQLIHLLGRDALNAEVRASGNSAPDRTVPFLTTREVFALKADPARGARYATATEGEQSALLETLAQEIARDPARVAAPTFTAPTLGDQVEWFASPQDVRKVLAEIAALPDRTARDILAVSPSITAARRKDFTYAGFKGGSEPGVLNLTWLLQKPDGAWRVLTLSWNDPAKPVDTTTLELLAQRIMALP
jgi:beta-lactamase class A